MSLNSVRFECTTLGNKIGKLTKDKDGCYIMPVGGLNVYNSAGQYYVYEQAKKLFEGSSQFMRRVGRAVVRAEVGHPVREPGMSESDYARRILTIRESNDCAFHKEIWLDFDSVKDEHGKPVIAIMSKVCPSGPHADMLERAFNNPGENVCFSIRAFTPDYKERGIYKRALDTIVTFDYVNEPGIAFADKFNAPSLEAEVLDTSKFTRSTIEAAIDEGKKSGQAQESTLLTANELFASMGWSTPDVAPNYYNWK